MIVIMRDAVMPECCKTCVCSEGYGCGITSTIMTTKEMESRPDWCPLEEVEPCEDAVSRKAVQYLLAHFVDEDKYVDACNGLNHLPSVTPKQRWIPCSETVDIPDHEVIACDKRGELIIGYLAYLDEQWLCESEVEMMYDPIAWMEKPEPYKGETDG